ncbi:hypothetical protein D9619_002111 [Psilocybe cf. subviscida]|uniref:Uncharacterized protein n=1 Tax=Psilocybe cf. subviscida TaxID=2480587 RepID=A0A8H5F2F9_9AGAR|nr:hypothetical protein D9619_002111 [Psilocybe cf. subviscida]
MYPQESCSKMSQEEWLGALRLAHKWQFGKIRDKAIAKLQPEISEWTPDKKINLGLQFLVQDWVRAGLVDLVQNQELETDNLMKDPYNFDQYIVPKIFYVQSKASFEVAHIRNATCRSCADDSYVYPEWDALYLKAARKLVDSVFADELKKARHPDDKPESEFVEGAAPRGIKRVSEPQSEKSVNELSEMRFRSDNVVETSQGGRKRRSLAS